MPPPRLSMHRFEDRGHFMNSRLPELADALEPRLRRLIAADG